MGHFDERALAGLAARTYTYRMLHIVFGSEPTEQELTLLGGEATAEACAALAAVGYDGAALLTTAIAPFADRLEAPTFADELRVQYTRLFMVPGDGYVKPWESVYATAEATLFTRRTLDVRATYESLGFQAQEKGHFPEDHLSMMLDFMAAVAERAYEAAAAGDDERAARLLDAQVAFAAKHLSNWLPKLVEALEAHDASGFFAACGRVTKAFVEEDCRLMRELIAPLVPACCCES